MRVSAKADYAIRAMVELAAAGAGPVKGERLAQAQQIPINFLENILGDLRNGGLIRSQRASEGGYCLPPPPPEINPPQVIRPVAGPAAILGHARPQQLCVQS